VRGPILPETLPSGVEVLHQMVRALARDLERLNRQFELLQRHTFGRRREAFHPGQQLLEFAECHEHTHTDPPVCGLVGPTQSRVGWTHPESGWLDPPMCGLVGPGSESG